MAARQFILRRRARSQIAYANAYRREHFSDLNVLSDRALRAKYRLPRAEIHRLLRVVSPHLRRPTRRNNALSPEVQLLAALRFYASGSFQEVVGDGTALSKASVSRSVAAVTPILVRHARQHIKMPSTVEEVLRQVHRGFYRMALLQVEWVATDSLRARVCVCVCVCVRACLHVCVCVYVCVRARNFNLVYAHVTSPNRFIPNVHVDCRCKGCLNVTGA